MTEEKIRCLKAIHVRRELVLDEPIVGGVTWDRTPPTNVQWLLHTQSLLWMITQMSSMLDRALGSDGSNYLVGGTVACDIIVTLSEFQSGKRGKAHEDDLLEIGMLGELIVFRSVSPICGIDGDMVVGRLDSRKFCIGTIIQSGGPR